MTKWRPRFGIVPWVDEVRPAAVEIDAGDVTPEVCREFKSRGIKVQAKTLGADDRPEVWDRVAAAGVDWIQTDFAEEVIARQTLKKIGPKPVKIAHHRGASRYAPENTLPALEKAIRLGADFVEFDLQTTRDGGFVLLHDRSAQPNDERARPGQGMGPGQDPGPRRRFLVRPTVRANAGSDPRRVSRSGRRPGRTLRRRQGHRPRGPRRGAEAPRADRAIRRLPERGLPREAAGDRPGHSPDASAARPRQASIPRPSVCSPTHSTPTGRSFPRSSSTVAMPKESRYSPMRWVRTRESKTTSERSATAST